DYDITLNTKDILSLRLNALGCGAYCDTYNIYLNFDLHTGEALKIRDVIKNNEPDSFRVMVFGDKINALEHDKKQKDSLLKAGQIDSSDHEFTMDYIKENCMKETSIDNFLLYKTFL